MSNITIKRHYLVITAVFAVILVLLNTQSAYSQGRDRSKYRVVSDSGFVLTDTTTVTDTSITKITVDSTARLKYFVFEHKDLPTASYDQYNSPFLLKRSDRIEYKLDFDSSNNVIISEFIEGVPVKMPVTIPLDRYLELRSKRGNKEIFYDIVAKNFEINTQDDLQKIFSGITDIIIPLPFASETIFGPPTIHLTNNGQIDITGSYEKNSTDQQTYSNIDNTQNNINFKQEVQITTKGTVGDKLTIEADWNSQRTFEFENQLKLKYKGYEDEVVKSIEAGNVSLDTRSNLIGSTAALFGIKGQFKLGPLTITALASQKKSETKEVNITGGTQETRFDIPIWQYSDNHYFLDTSYRSVYENYYKTVQTNFQTDSIVVEDLQVWAQTDVSEPLKRYAVSHVQLAPRPAGGYNETYRNTDEIPGRRFGSYFKKLAPGVDFTAQLIAGYLTINVSSYTQAGDGIAVAYKVQKNGQTVTQYGDYDVDVGNEQTLVLKTVRIKNLKSPQQDTAYKTAWDLKIKSIYSLGVRKINNDQANLKLDIVKRPPSGEPIKNYNEKTYLNLTYLDIRRNGSSAIDSLPNGDGQFDFFPGKTVDINNGYVIFPTLEPFWTTLIQQDVPADSLESNIEVYRNSKTIAQNTQPKFYLVGTAIGDVSSRYTLGFNVVEGSVKVFNGSTKLTQNIDYTVDYITGELVITNAAALVAGQNLKITFEQNDLFQLASKTLLGTRAELQINKTSYLGFTMLNLKQETLNDKVRIGEEPTNNTILGLDAATEIKTNFLTKLLNKIPGYNTKEESVLTLRSEFAYMLPDPNTMKSRIPSDNNEAVAYIDDFEGVKKIIPIGINPLSWTISSIPIDREIINPHSDSLMSLRRAKLQWYSALNSVAITEVYPNRNVGNNQSQTLSPMIVTFMPDSAGTYNFIKQTTFSGLGEKQKNWGGFFKFLNTSQTNLVDENINFIELWMRVNADSGSTGKMIIDLGSVHEKVIVNSKFKPNSIKKYNFHTEDLDGNGTLGEGEDVGLDGYRDQEEYDIWKNQMGIEPDNPQDPNRDNFLWIQESNDYTRFNGTEGNANLFEGRRMDTEDLDGDGTLSTINSYRRYEIELDPAKVKNNKFVQGGGNERWYQYLIPLDEFASMEGLQNLTDVRFVRVWFKGFNTTSSVEIVDFNLVGNQWIKSDKTDTTYSISVVNIEDNPNIYQPPVPNDVLRQRDQSNLDQDVLLNEQSISLDVRNVLPGQQKFIFKSFNLRPIDMLNYKVMKMFVNGDKNFRFMDTANYDADFIVRIGSDTANYYEYRAPVHPDERPSTPWNSLNEVSINFSDLTAIKQLRDSANGVNYMRVPNGPPGAYYGIVGNPSLSNITQIMLGVGNHRGSPIYAETISGSVWFNELRVIKTNDNDGYAFTFNAGLKLGDLANLNFAFNKTDPNFHTLENRFGNRILSSNWDISGSVNAHKIVNSLLSSLISTKLKDFFTIPLTFSHTEVFDKPNFVPSTDVDLETAALNRKSLLLRQGYSEEFANYEAEKLRVASQNLRVTNRFAITGMKLNFPEEHFFVKELLNKLEFSFYKNSITERSTTTESRYAWDMGGNVGLTSNLDLMDKYHLKLGKLLPLGDEFKEAKMYFFLPFIPLAPLYTNSINMGASFTRTRGDELLRTQLRQSPTSRNFNSNRNFGMDWKFLENWLIDIAGTYSFQAGSDLTYLETYNDQQTQRPEGQIVRDIFFNDKLINFGKDQTASQVVSVNPKLNIPFLKKFMDLTGSYRVQYNWQTSPTNTLLGNNVGYNSDMQVSAYIKLNEVFNLFKSDNPKSGSNPQQEQQDPSDIFKFFKSFVPQQITLNYSQGKIMSNPGVQGRPGFSNFWMAYNSADDMGPSRFYQMGWTNDPGKRVPFTNIQDREAYTNNLSLSTMINPIFPDNLKINLQYKSAWSNNNTLSYISDAFGFLSSPTNLLGVRTVSRPSFFISGDVRQVLANPDVTLPKIDQARLITQSFENDVVSFPFPTWTLNLSGVEKFDLFKDIAQSINIESAYTSEYIKTYKYNSPLPEYIESQSIRTGFNPLFGVNFTFNQLEGGNLTASLRFNKTNEYTLDPASAKINNIASSDFSLSANFTKSGFTIPLFGLALQNDLTIGFSFTRKQNDPKLLEYISGSWLENIQNGTITTSVNPSIQYALSRSVTLMLFYNYSKTQPVEGNLQIPTTTSNEGGLNVKLTIQ